MESEKLSNIKIIEIIVTVLALIESATPLFIHMTLWNVNDSGIYFSPDIGILILLLKITLPILIFFLLIILFSDESNAKSKKDKLVLKIKEIIIVFTLIFSILSFLSLMMMPIVNINPIENPKDINNKMISGYANLPNFPFIYSLWIISYDFGKKKYRILSREPISPNIFGYWRVPYNGYYNESNNISKIEIEAILKEKIHQSSENEMSIIAKKDMDFDYLPNNSPIYSSIVIG